MPFEFRTEFPETDPECVAHFAPSFQHVDWIDGSSIVQAEQTPTEEGFNSRFRKIMADLEAAGDDAKRALDCTATVRRSLFAIIQELETELERIGGPVEEWNSPTLASTWIRSGQLGNPNPPGFFKDHYGMVHLRGFIDGGPNPSATNSFSSLVWRLPRGYRPPHITQLMAFTFEPAPTFLATKAVRLDVGTDGTVTLREPYASGHGLVLDGLSFRSA
ncbi:hypothetical protein [Nocardia xishanensis]